MSKCLVCKKTNDGIVCKHCVAKNAANIGVFARKGIKFVGGCVLAITTIKQVTDKIRIK